MTKNAKRPLAPVARAHNSYNQFFKPTFWAITLVLGATIPVALLPTFIVSAIFYFATGVANRESFAGAFLLGARKDADVKTTLISMGILAYLFIANTGFLIRTGFPPQAIYPAEYYNVFFILATALTVIDTIALSVTCQRIKNGKL